MTKYIVSVFILFILTATLTARAEPTDIEYIQAIELAVTRIEGEPRLLEFMAQLNLAQRQDFIASLALTELLAMENKKQGVEDGKAKSESF